MMKSIFEYLLYIYVILRDVWIRNFLDNDDDDDARQVVAALDIVKE